MTVTVNLDCMLARLTTALSAAHDHVCHGLQVGPDQEATSRRIRYVVLPAPSLPPDERLDAYRRWLLGCALRDCVEAVGEYLNEVRGVCAYCRMGPAWVITEQWKSADAEDAQAFASRHLPNKLDTLRQTYGIATSRDGFVKALIRVRRCLVHGQGIVGTKDANCNDGLRLQWERVELYGEDGGGRRSLNVGDEVAEGGEISVAIVQATRLFRLAEPVQLCPQEFEELCFSLVQYGKEVVRRVLQYAVERGIPQAAASAQP